MGHQDNAGKFIAFILRHHPEAIGMKLDEHGWARTEDLIAGIAKSRPFDMQMLEEIVRCGIKTNFFHNFSVKKSYDEITNKIGYVTSNESLFPGGNGFFLRFANLCSNSSIIVPQENLWKEVFFL